MQGGGVRGGVYLVIPDSYAIGKQPPKEKGAQVFGYVARLL